MAFAPSTTNYRRGKGHVLFEKNYTGGYFHLGNVPKLEINVEFTKEEHFSSMEGTKSLDLEEITEKKVTIEADLEEFTAENLDLIFMSDGITSSTQSASEIDAVDVTTIDERYVDLGKKNLTYLKIYHGTTTGGNFAGATSVTGPPSFDIVWADTTNKILYCINASASPAVGATITDGTASATVDRVETIEGIIATDHATVPTKMYVEGTDYDVIPAAGLLREYTGKFAAHHVFVSCDYPALTIKTVKPLKNNSCEGRLKYVGTNEQGLKINHVFHKVQLTLGGAFGLISEDLAAAPVSISVLKDTTRAAGDQFFSTEIIG